jgi:hypothetical protein
MWRWGHRGAAILLGGAWILLFNGDPKAPNAPLSAWDEVDDFDTMQMCQQGLLQKVLELSAKESKGVVRKSDTLKYDALRYRCVHADTLKPLKAPKSAPTPAPAPRVEPPPRLE